MSADPVERIRIALYDLFTQASSICSSCKRSDEEGREKGPKEGWLEELWAFLLLSSPTSSIDKDDNADAALLSS